MALTLARGCRDPKQYPFPTPCKECTDPEKYKVRQKLKAEEWDELLAKGKRFRVLQPVKIGCVWADSEGCPAADLKVLQQFAICLLDPAPSEDELVPKASRREKRDQQSEWAGGALVWGWGPGLTDAKCLFCVERGHILSLDCGHFNHCPGHSSPSAVPS